MGVNNWKKHTEKIKEHKHKVIKEQEQHCILHGIMWLTSALCCLLYPSDGNQGRCLIWMPNSSAPHFIHNHASVDSVILIKCH